MSQGSVCPWRSEPEPQSHVMRHAVCGVALQRRYLAAAAGRSRAGREAWVEEEMEVREESSGDRPFEKPGCGGKRETGVARKGQERPGTPGFEESRVGARRR